MSDIDRFLTKIQITETGCHRWTAAHNNAGYGMFRINEPRRMVLAHRWAYEHFVSPIGEGEEIDHVWDRGCRHTDCVNPAHLEAVTHRINMARGAHARKTECKRRHPFDAENTHIRKDGSRLCRACKNLRQRTT